MAQAHGRVDSPRSYQFPTWGGQTPGRLDLRHSLSPLLLGPRASRPQFNLFCFVLNLMKFDVWKLRAGGTPAVPGGEWNGRIERTGRRAKLSDSKPIVPGESFAMSTLQRLTDRGLAKPPRWLPGNVQYETIMGSVGLRRLLGHQRHGHLRLGHPAQGRSVPPPPGRDPGLQSRGQAVRGLPRASPPRPRQPWRARADLAT